MGSSLWKSRPGISPCPQNTPCFELPFSLFAVLCLEFSSFSSGCGRNEVYLGSRHHIYLGICTPQDPLQSPVAFGFYLTRCHFRFCHRHSTIPHPTSSPTQRPAPFALFTGKPQTYLVPLQPLTLQDQDPPNSPK